MAYSDGFSSGEDRKPGRAWQMGRGFAGRESVWRPGVLGLRVLLQLDGDVITLQLDQVFRSELFLYWPRRENSDRGSSGRSRDVDGGGGFNVAHAAAVCWIPADRED